MKILVTGAAGFIGFHLCQKLLEENHTVLGIDNINNYYDVNLKKNRLKNLLKKNDQNIFSILKKISTKFFLDHFFLSLMSFRYENVLKT